MGACPQPHCGRGNQEIPGPGRHCPLWKAGGDCRSDELSRIPGGEVDDGCFRSHGWRRDQGNLGHKPVRYLIHPVGVAWQKGESMEVAISNRIDINQRPTALSADSLAECYSQQEGTMERRTFIGAVTGASLGLLLEHPVNAFARAQNTTQTVAGHSSFETSQVEVSGNTIFVRRYGK